jgi:cobalt-zinc-cadmium efflux system membrane fusion protein
MKHRNLTILGVVVLLAIVGGGSVWGIRWQSTKPAEAEGTPPPAKSPTTVVLTPEKAEALQIRCEPAERRAMQEMCVVPGRLGYRRVRHVELRVPVDAVVQEVKVKPGAVVAAGTPLALLTSPGVGLARAEVEKSESELRIANRAQEWNDAITRNLGELLTYLRKQPNSPEVEQKFNDKLLGEHRQNVLPAYSKFILAQRIWVSAEKAVQKGAISEKTEIGRAHV